MTLSTLPTLNALYAALKDKATVYQHGEAVPETLPDTFIVLTPGFSTVRQQWASRRGITHETNLLLAARGPGTLRDLAEEINQALPATGWQVVGTLGERYSGTHYELPLTIRAHP